MQNRTFIPYLSFGDIFFGEHYVAVRKKLNTAFKQQYVDDAAKNFMIFLMT